MDDSKRPTVPWEYSKAPEPGAPAVINLPTPEGRVLGRHLARLCDEAEREQRAQFPNQKPRCHDCAFRRGTRPNGCPGTLMDAIKCAVEGDPFLCHVGMENGEGEPRGVCQGWLIMSSTGVAADRLKAARLAVEESAARVEQSPILLGPVEEEDHHG